MADIKESIEKAVQFLSENPGEARYTDSLATARLGDSLRTEVEGPNGETVVTDMPEGVGGRGEHQSPGWFFRAALASCIATTIGMEAARAGIELTSLEVDVDSESDDRGILALDDEVPAGPLSSRIRVRITADGVDPQVLNELVAWADHHSPISDAIRRAVPLTVEVESADMELT